MPLQQVPFEGPGIFNLYHRKSKLTLNLIILAAKSKSAQITTTNKHDTGKIVKKHLHHLYASYTAAELHGLGGCRAQNCCQNCL
jgi:hypothetical protein